MKLTLIQRDDCPLCDDAWSVLADAGVRDFDSLWIDKDEGLQKCYGARVPVLRREDNAAEIDWPFAANDVRLWLVP